MIFPRFLGNSVVHVSQSLLTPAFVPLSDKRCSEKGRDEAKDLESNTTIQHP